MIEIEGNRLYIDGLFVCYATHQISSPVDATCYLSFSHRHGCNLVNVAGQYWLGDDDGSLPRADIVIGHVVGPNGLLPDPSTMVRITEYLQVKEDDGRNVRIKVN
jgi:hypothetical protein